MIHTAVVSNGNLLLQDEDGSIINAGRVQGAPGTPGERGLMGMQGEKGADGKDGSTIHSGFGVPDDSDYSDRDLYIDVSTPNLDLYQKIQGAWAKLGGLKGQPGAPGKTGKNGLQGTRPPITSDDPPSKHPLFPDGSVDSELQEGDIWIGPNNQIFIYQKTRKRIGRI